MLPWTPSLIKPSLELWVEGGSASNYILSGEDILQWTDLSGNARHLTPATSLKPKRLYDGTFFSSGVDALITPEFANPTGADGISFFMTLDSWSAIPVTWSNVLTKGAVNTQWSFIIENASQGNNGIIRAALTDSGFTSAQVGTGGQVIAGSILNSGMALTFDSVLVASAGPVARNFGGASRLTVGSSPSNNYADNRFLGWMGDLIVTNKALGNDDFQRMIGYLSWMRGLQAQLPVGHPYANAAPQAYAYEGTVANSSGAGAARLIRCYRDSDGALVGETLSASNGSYAIAVPTNVAHSLVASGESGKNSLILGGVMPG
ncbi:MAG: hypothetical protein EOM24_23185 [Chloroflexia bacterium]|nr:hypothetical protein [Chloroflexia bacterium]